MLRSSMTEREMEKFIAKTDKYRGEYYHTTQDRSGAALCTMICAWTAANWDLINAWTRSWHTEISVLERIKVL